MAQTLPARFYDWLRARVPIDAAIEFAGHKKVPHYTGSVWYYFGGISLFLFIIQVVTGILLMMYYQPGAADGVRVGALHRRVRQVRLAHPLDPHLVGEPDDRRRRSSTCSRSSSRRHSASRAS